MKSGPTLHAVYFIRPVQSIYGYKHRLYGTDSVKIYSLWKGKVAAKYLWMYGYFLRCMHAWLTYLCR